MKTPSQHGKHLESNPKKKAKGCGNYTEHGIGGYNNIHQSHQMEESIHPAAQQTRQWETNRTENNIQRQHAGW